MPERKKGRRKDEQDELIEKLVPDPANPPDAQILRGFLGKSSRANCRRLYLTPELNDYLEIQEDDILHSESASSGESTLEGSIVWVKRGASIQRTTTRPVDAQAEFLTGDVSEMLPGAGLGGGLLSRGPIGPIGPFTIGECPTMAHCPTMGISCPTAYNACPSYYQWQCLTNGGPWCGTLNPQCFTSNPHVCQTTQNPLQCPTVGGWQCDVK